MIENSTVANLAFDTMCARIRREVAVGGHLVGMKFYESFNVRPEKADDLPRVYIVDYSDKENHGGGGTGEVTGANSILRNTATVGIQLVVDTRNGWSTPSTVTSVKKMGLLNIKNLILDGIETDDSGNPDARLDGTLDKPVMFVTRESGVFDLGLVMDIGVTLDSLRISRQTRAWTIDNTP